MLEWGAGAFVKAAFASQAAAGATAQTFFWVHALVLPAPQIGQFM
jgi:hypothetical protein